MTTPNLPQRVSALYHQASNILFSLPLASYEPETFIMICQTRFFQLPPASNLIENFIVILSKKLR